MKDLLKRMAYASVELDSMGLFVESDCVAGIMKKIAQTPSPQLQSRQDAGQFDPNVDLKGVNAIIDLQKKHQISDLEMYNTLASIDQNLANNYSAVKRTMPNTGTASTPNAQPSTQSAPTGSILDALNTLNSQTSQTVFGDEKPGAFLAHMDDLLQHFAGENSATRNPETVDIPYKPGAVDQQNLSAVTKNLLNKAMDVYHSVPVWVGAQNTIESIKQSINKILQNNANSAPVATQTPPPNPQVNIPTDINPQSGLPQGGMASSTR